MSLSDLPFPLHAMMPAGPLTAPLDLAAVAEADDDLPPEAADWPSTAEVIELFVHAVNRRLLDPTGGQAAVLSRAWDANLPGWRFQLALPGLDLAALRVLCALLTQTHHAFEPLARLELSTDIPPGLARSGLADAAPGWPPPPVARPFALDPADPDSWPFPGEAYSVTFDFATPPPAVPLADFTEALNVWDHLRILGGFNQDFAEVEDMDDFGQIVHETPTRVRVDARRVSADPCELHALLQLAVAIHGDGQTLTAVSIEV